MKAFERGAVCPHKGSWSADFGRFYLGGEWNNNMLDSGCFAVSLSRNSDLGVPQIDH